MVLGLETEREGFCSWEWRCTHSPLNHNILQSKITCLSKWKEAGAADQVKDTGIKRTLWGCQISVLYKTKRPAPKFLGMFSSFLVLWAFPAWSGIFGSCSRMTKYEAPINKNTQNGNETLEGRISNLSTLYIQYHTLIYKISFMT